MTESKMVVLKDDEIDEILDNIAKEKWYCLANFLWS